MSKSTPIKYTASQIREVVDYATKYNTDHGQGGQREAAKYFGVSQLTVASWLKASPPSTFDVGRSTLDVPSEVTTDQPRDPAWDQVREACDQIRMAGRLFLRGQVRLGMLLAALKKQSGIHAGQPKKNSPDSGKYSPWADLVKDQTGYSRQSCDEFIRLFEATTAKLKKGKKLALPAPVKKQALVLFQSENPLSLTEEQWGIVDEVIATLTTGETQASLMQELGLVPKPPKMPKKTGGTEGPEDEATAGQLAFHFFDAMLAPVVNARTNPDYKKLLYALPLESTEEHPLSLATWEAELRASLADVEEAKQAQAKPAKGRVINA